MLNFIRLLLGLYKKSTLARGFLQMFSLQPPLIVSHWMESPYIILVWSNEAFAFMTSAKNPCCKYKDQDQIYASNEPSVFQKLYLKNGVCILVYNMLKSALSLHTLALSVKNQEAHIFSFNQPNKVPYVERVHVVHLDGPIDCLLRLYKDEVALKEMVQGTVLSVHDENVFPFILPDSFNFDNEDFLAL